MSYIPGAGQKKPLNVLEAPIYPDIRKAPPRFRDAGKHWKVDVGQTLLDLEGNRQIGEHAVLVQARDYNSHTAYGVSSHKDVVNKEFRPPLKDPQEDFFALHMLPRKTVVPRINPGTADTDTRGYAAKNERMNGVENHLSDRVGPGEWHAGFFCPVDMPLDNSVLPDLETQLPNYSASAGFQAPYTVEPSNPEVHIEYESYTPGMDAGMNTPINIDGPTGRETFELGHNRPQVSASAGMNTPLQIDMETPLTNLWLDPNRPSFSASAGMNTPIHLDGKTGYETVELETSIQPLLDAGTTSQYRADNIVHQPDDTAKVQMQRPSYSYSVPKTYSYRTPNEQSYRPHFTRKLHAPHSQYAKGYIPRSGVDIQPVALRKDVQKKKAIYNLG